MFDVELTDQVCRVAFAGGFAVCGAVHRSALALVPPSADPERILPGYQSVVVIGAAPGEVISSGPYGPALLQPRPAAALSRIRSELEAAGYRVRPVAEGGISLPRMAVAAGLGDLSPVHMLVVSGHGQSLTLFGLVSDAPLGGPLDGPLSAALTAPLVAPLGGPLSAPPGAPLVGTSAGLESQGRHCNACGACTVDCPAMLPGEFDRDWCVGCGVCVDLCPQGG